ncbi:MAG: AAA family ATPase [Actinobacteria bacterium]|nr:AAA family ATPase [Actinomycetota bacterium]
MPTLILLNGPPSSGKSTLAARLVATRPLMLDLDVDVVRGMLGAWIDQPHDAGLAARRLALAMAGTHLAAGHDVVVPQFIARDTFIIELETVARDAGARFVEIALLASRDDTLRWFSERSAAPENQQHRDALQLVERSGGSDALGESHDRFGEFLDTRPNARRITVIRGDLEATLRLVETAIES